MQTFGILVHADDTISVLWGEVTGSPPRPFTVTHLEPDGTELGSVALTNSASFDPRLAFDPDDAYCRVFAHASDGRSQITTVALSRVIVYRTAYCREYEGGVDRGTPTATPDARFGHSQSCPLFVLRGATSVFVDLSEPCCPPDCPPNRKIVTPSLAPLPTHTGAILGTVNPAVWEQQCEGGGAVPSGPDPTDSEDWTAY